MWMFAAQCLKELHKIPPLQQENSTKLHFLGRFDELRHARGLTEAAMAEDLGYTRFTIQKIRSGEMEPSKKLLQRLRYAEAATKAGMAIKFDPAGIASQLTTSKLKAFASQLRKIADEIDPPVTTSSDTLEEKMQRLRGLAVNHPGRPEGIAPSRKAAG